MAISITAIIAMMILLYGVLGAPPDWPPIESAALLVLLACIGWISWLLVRIIARLEKNDRRSLHDCHRLALLEERHAISVEVHDGVIQSIHAIALGLETMRADAETTAPKAAELLDLSIVALGAIARDVRACTTNPCS